MKPKKKQGKILTLNLDEEEVKLMELDMARDGINNRSQYIGWLIRQRNESINPAEHLKALERKEQDLDKELKEIKNQRKKAIENLELQKEIILAKQKKRPQAIAIIQRKLIEEGHIVAEQVAKTWSMLLNCEPAELLVEVMRKVKNENKIY